MLPYWGFKYSQKKKNLNCHPSKKIPKNWILNDRLNIKHIEKAMQVRENQNYKKMDFDKNMHVQRIHS